MNTGGVDVRELQARIEKCLELNFGEWAVAAIMAEVTAALDAAVTRGREQARLDEAKWWRHLVFMHEDSYFAVEGDKRIAELELAAIRALAPVSPAGSGESESA